MKKIYLVIALGAALALTGCIDEPRKPSSDKLQAQQQEQLAIEAAMAVPSPAIVNFTEKRLLKELYELRDQPNYRTYAYLVTLDGHYVKLCDSIGYGLPASVQFSNPEKQTETQFYTTSTNYGTVVMPQAEPNGLFMPDGLSATYVMCLDPTTKDVKPVYVEPNVVVSPFPLAN